MLPYLFPAADAPSELDAPANGFIAGNFTFANSSYSSFVSIRKNSKHHHCYMHRQMPK